MAVLLESGATPQVASAQATRVFGKNSELDNEKIVDTYKNSKSKFRDAILTSLGVDINIKKDEEQLEEEKLLKIMLSGEDVETFHRKIAENDEELIERYLMEKQGIKPKMAKYLAGKSVSNGRVKHNSKYFALCKYNKEEI